jgi:hypothetical protein
MEQLIEPAEIVGKVRNRRNFPLIALHSNQSKRPE